MNKLFLVVRREFVTRVRKKSFIILTLLMPLLCAALVFVPILFATIKDNGQKAVGIDDKTGLYFRHFKSSEAYRFVTVPDGSDKQLYSEDSPYEAVVVIGGRLADKPGAVTVFSRKEVPVGLLSSVKSTLNDCMRQEKLQDAGIPGLNKIIDDMQTEVNVTTMKLNDQGQASVSNSDVAVAVGFLVTFVIYIFIMSYGVLVMQSVLEEKENRIVEIIVSSIKPFQLMLGKIVAIALVGIVQLLIWSVLFAVLLLVGGAILGLSASDMTQTATIAQAGAAAAPLQETSVAGEILSALFNLPLAEIAVCFVLYFIGGYLLYASLFAAIGAAINEPEDTSQFITPVVLIMLFGLYASLGSVDNTDGPLAFWASLIPFTSPMTMMVRIPFHVPLWQELVSLVLLYGTALALVWTSGRIYRVGILMYGKKPSLRELWRWVRSK